jgi:GNAT superfamily N-acetyltransferase
MILIEPATVADARDALAFLSAFRAEGLQTVLRHDRLPSVEDEEALIRRLDGAAGIMFLARANGKVVGCLTAESRPSPRQPPGCEFGMGVLREYRNQGLGSRLLEQLTAWAKRGGFERLELSVFVTNVDAIRFYRRHGYEMEGAPPQPVRQPGAPAVLICMARAI